MNYRSSGICGWLGPGAGGERDPLENMLELLQGDTRVARKGRTHAGSCAVVGDRANVSCYEGSSIWVAATGRPKIQGGDFADIARAQGAAAAIERLYSVFGLQLLERVTGSFAIALLDGQTGKALLAVDRLGIAELYYQHVGANLVFSSRLRAIDGFPGADSGISAQAIYDYVYHHVVSGPKTIFRDRRRLMPGECLVWDGGRLAVRRYWEVVFTEDRPKPFGELKEQFKGLLHASVEEAVTDAGNVGAFLSGGTDSSTVTGLLAQRSASPVPAYSIGFDASGYDETHYASIAARHFGAAHRVHYVSPEDVCSAIPLVAQSHEQPFGNASAVPAYYCARAAAADGIDTLLGGDGGDELFGGNTRYAMQSTYSLYGDLPLPLRKRVLEPILSALPAMKLVQKARRFVEHASLPMPARYDLYNLVSHIGAQAIFCPEFLAEVDVGRPAREMDELYGAVKARSLVNRMLGMDLKYTLADNDLPKVVRACTLAQVEVRFPLLNDALVEFAAALPPEQKLRGTRLRPFFKEALVDFLPRQIIRKQKHGFGLPFGQWLRTNRQLGELTRQHLEQLKGRNIVRRQLIDELINVQVAVHPSYFGTLAWILMMLEQWFVDQERWRGKVRNVITGNGPVEVIDHACR